MQKRDQIKPFQQVLQQVQLRELLKGHQPIQQNKMEDKLITVDEKLEPAQKLSQAANNCTLFRNFHRWNKI